MPYKVSQNGKVISGGESGDPNGAVMTMTDMTGSVMIGPLGLGCGL